MTNFFKNSPFSNVCNTECAIIVALSYIIFEDKKMKPLDYPWNIDALLVLDTGSDLTHLDIVLYDLLIDAVCSFIVFIFLYSLTQ